MLSDELRELGRKSSGTDVPRALREVFLSVFCFSQTGRERTLGYRGVLGWAEQGFCKAE